MRELQTLRLLLRLPAAPGLSPHTWQALKYRLGQGGARLHPLHGGAGRGGENPGGASGGRGRAQPPGLALPSDSKVRAPRGQADINQ